MHSQIFRHLFFRPVLNYQKSTRPRAKNDINAECIHNYQFSSLMFMLFLLAAIQLLYSYYIATIQVLYSYHIATIQRLHKYYIATIQLLYSYYTATIQLLYRYHIATIFDYEILGDFSFKEAQAADKLIISSFIIAYSSFIAAYFQLYSSRSRFKALASGRRHEPEAPKF